MCGACFTCKWRGEVPGSAHSSCHHPTVASLTDDTNPFSALMMLLAGPRQITTMEKNAPAVQLGIVGDPHGISHGWFAWPWNFDPVWLVECQGYEAKETTPVQRS